MSPRPLRPALNGRAHGLPHPADLSEEFHFPDREPCKEWSRARCRVSRWRKAIRYFLKFPERIRLRPLRQEQETQKSIRSGGSYADSSSGIWNSWTPRRSVSSKRITEGIARCDDSFQAD